MSTSALAPAPPAPTRLAAPHSTSIADALGGDSTRLVIDPEARPSERLARLAKEAAQADLVLVVSAARAYRESAGRSFGQALAQRLGGDESLGLALSTAVHEATVNAAVHGALGLALPATTDHDPDTLLRYIAAVEEAVAHAPAAASAIVLIAWVRTDTIEVVVCDDGNGFDHAGLQAEPAQGGRGIGLMRELARDVGHVDGGRICIMTFELPRAGGQHGLEAEARPPLGGFDVTSCRLLLVDDERVNLELMRRALQAAGYAAIRTARSGREALAITEQWQPDLMLLDMRMPGIDGLETCRRLRAAPQTAKLPIVMQTAAVGAAERTMAFAAGASDFVTKPLHLKELEARVGLLLQNRATIAHLEEIQYKLSAELSEARRVQQALLPGPTDIAKWERRAGARLAAEWRPSSMLGGDIWGLCNVPERPPGLFVADFSGHGIGAALHASVLCREIQRNWPVSRSPGDLLARLNRELAGSWSGGCFAAVTMVEVHDSELRYATAGAPPLRCRELDGAWRTLPSRGLPVGILAEAAYVERAVAFRPGCRLLAHTDGLSELPTGEGRCAEDGALDAALGRCTAPGPVAALRRLMHELLAQAGPTLPDDLTAVWLDRI